MHAKIMLLPGSARGEALCRCAEQVLTDVSAAFQHSFSLLREKIGEQSLQAYQEPLTEEAVAACEKSQAVLLGDDIRALLKLYSGSTEDSEETVDSREAEEEVAEDNDEDTADSSENDGKENLLGESEDDGREAL